MRRLIVRLHRWLGFSVGVLFVLIGLSGSALVYAPEIERQMYPSLAQDLPAGWRAFRPALLARFAARDGLVLVRFPGGEYNAYQLYLQDGAQEFRDPVDGHLLVQRGLLGDFVIAAREFHTALFGGATGERILGWLGLAMLALLAGGIWLWWPRGGRWRHAFRRPSPLSSQRLFRSRPQLVWWHKTLGIVIVAPLLLITLTGTALIFYYPAQALLTTAFGGKPPELPTRVPGAGTGDTDWQAVVAMLDRTLPAGRTVFFYPPQDPRAPLLFRKRMPGELHPNGRSYVALAGDGKLLYARDASAAAAGMQATNTIYPLHSGKVDAPVYRAVVLCLGLVPLFFFATGIWTWYLRRHNGRRPILQNGR